MPMGDELASTSLGFAQKSMEISVELIKMLAPLVQKLWNLSGQKAEATKIGEVSRGELLLEADKSNSAILGTNNFLPSSDAQKIAAKAKDYGIPVSLVGNGEKVTLNYLERDSAVIKQIEMEIIAERFKEQPQDYKHFKIYENNIAAMKAEFEKNDVECQFTRGANGETYCTFLAKDSEKVNLIKQDFKAIRNEVAENFKAEPSKTGLGIVTDIKTGKTLDLKQFGGKVKKYQIVNLLQKEFGYSSLKANLAANKLCDDLRLNANEYLSHNKQLEKINSLKTNIRYESDSILMRDVTFSEVNFKDGNNTHISISFGEKSTVLTPDTMSTEEMKKICVSELGMKEEMADEAVLKSSKINTQINSKINSRFNENIRYENDNILLHDITFSTVNFKDGESTHISISFDDKSAVLIPDTMSVEEMKKICISELGMKEEMADEVVRKSDKINRQVKSKLNEIKIDRTTGVAQEIKITRTKNNSFSVVLGNTSKSYDFKDERLVQNIAKDLGVSSDKAKKIIDKAKAQSTFQNNISNAAKRMASAAKENISRGAETVTRGMRKGVK